MGFLEIRGISKAFDAAGTRREVLRGVTLSIERGDFVSIVGMMGCGKSTLLKIAGGLLDADSGSVAIEGKAVTAATGIRRDAAFVFQNYSLLPWFSALENVRLAVGAAFPDWSKDRQREQAARHLAAVGLGQALHRRPGQLSGGMRQRVAIARAFAIEPGILFLDEPFGALDALTRESLQQELMRLRSAAERSVTTLMITNSVDEALLLSDRVVPMTGRPSSLGAAVAIELARPRSADQLLHDERAAHVRSRVVSSLTDDLARDRRFGRPAADSARRDPSRSVVRTIVAGAEGEG